MWGHGGVRQLPLPGPSLTSPGDSPPSAAWEALLTGSAAAEAVRVAREISDAIEARAGRGSRADLGGGAAGFALLNAYLAAASDDGAARERALRWRRAAVEGLQRGMGVSLYGGGCGVLWVAQHTGGLLECATIDASEAMERALLTRLSGFPDVLEAELISGLAGYGVYAFERLPREGARECLEQVVARLGELAERAPAGIAWRASPDLIDTRRYNLGVAHGVPGVIPVLALCSAAGVAAARELTVSAVEWLLAQRLSGDPEAAFGYWIEAPEPARAAWCYGDPGIAAALLVAARALGRVDWEAEAIALARRAAARPPDGCGVVDPWLCHGAAGLGHLFNRIHQATGDESLAAGAKRWLERTLAMRDPEGDGFAGFHPRDVERELGSDGSGFLTGAAGVGLALLAAATDVEPAWDRLLVASPIGRRA